MAPKPGPTTGITATATSSATATATATAGAHPTATTPVPPTPVEDQPPPVHNVVLIVIDAGRPMYLQETKLPHIEALVKHGVSYSRATVGQMESSTPGVHVTLGTGTLPRENGFLGFGWVTPTQQWVDFRTLLADRQIDPVLRSLPVPSVAARLHQFYPHAVSVAASGHKDYAVVGLGGGAADYEIYGHFINKQFVPSFMHTPPPLTAAERQSLTVSSPLPMAGEDTWAFRYATTLAQHVRPRLLMINIPETDTWGHWYGPNDRTVFNKLMQNLDWGIGQIEQTYQKLGMLQNTDFIITADHGMMQSRSVGNWKQLQTDIRSWGVPVIRADSSCGAIWLKNPAQAQLAAEKLVALHPQHVAAILYRSGPGNNYQYAQASPNSWLASPTVGAELQQMANTTAGIHGPDLWVLYRENYTTDANNVSGKWKGTHGGSTWKVQHIPLIISGPGVKQGLVSSFPARSIDIAPTMERLLGLPYIKRDGVILADAFTNPLPGELGPERDLTPKLSKYVNALQLESESDDRLEKWPGGTVGPVHRCQNKHDPHCTISPTTATNG